MESSSDQKAKIHSKILGKRKSESSLEDLNKPKCYIGFYGNVILEHEVGQIAKWCDQISKEVNESKDAEVPIAFDMEWPFNYKTGPEKVSLIQMCKDLNTCFLFQVGAIQRLPEAFLKLIENPKIVFHGVKVKNDFRKLYRDFNEPRILYQVEKAVELGDLCNSVIDTRRNWSLANLTKEIIHTNMNKDKDVRMSRWNAWKLTAEQKMYAAVDVYAGQLIYKKLKRMQTQKEKESEKNFDNLISLSF